ncbi:MAG: hypothetical protein PHN19_01635 [Patescibacteria group bacterium]|nr:hypothetical protein [Patescibacteria group bacterium]
MQGTSRQLFDYDDLGRQMEKEYLEQGLYWGKIGTMPKNYTARIGLETYALTCGEIATLKRLEDLIPRFLRGCVDLARRSSNGEYSWLWQDLCCGRSKLQIEIWKKELERKNVILAKRIRIDAIRTAEGLKINEFTLGATGSGYGAVIDIISRNFFPDKKFFEPIAKKYVEAIHDLLPNGGNVGILLTPWRDGYGPEQQALTKLFEEYGKEFGLTFLFGISFLAEVKDDGVYLKGKKLDLVERVFKEYSEIDKNDLQKNRMAVFAADIEKKIIDAYFDGKVLLHPNLLTFLDYKELMAWLFDERLNEEWIKFLGSDGFVELKNFFAYTVVWKGNNFIWKGVEYSNESMQELSDMQIREYWFAFDNNLQLIGFRELGDKKDLELGKKIFLGLGDLKSLMALAKSTRGWKMADPESTKMVTMFKNVGREIFVMSGRENWFVKIRQARKRLDAEVVLKLSGGDNKAAGGHAVAISKGMMRSTWRKLVKTFAEMAKQRTVIAQEYCEMVIDEMMIFDPANKKADKENVRTRICVWYWLDNDANSSSFGGNTVTCIPISDGYIVHGRSNSAMTSCSFMD